MIAVRVAKICAWSVDVRQQVLFQTHCNLMPPLLFKVRRVHARSCHSALHACRHTLAYIGSLTLWLRWHGTFGCR